MAYAALLLQSLYYVPQVRHAVAQWGHMYYARQSLLNESGEVQHPAPGTPGVSLCIGSQEGLLSLMRIRRPSMVFNGNICEHGDCTAERSQLGRRR